MNDQHKHTNNNEASSKMPSQKAPINKGRPPLSKKPLALVHPVGQLMQPVFFVGFMGAGKTSLARKLARLCGVASVDLDTYLERQVGKKVKEIFADQGEESFRVLESQILFELSQKDPLLISCGGGIVLKPENRAVLKERGFVIHLLVTAEEAASRIGNLSTRPLFKNLALAQETIARRLPLYDEVANVVINTGAKKVGTVAHEVQGVLEERGILWRKK